ncbi:heat shock protein HtpX [Anatilimnocola aggregata]|uniref:Heat shock protein HtpX n=1 Tax=Anatilimnocola aggregata TaxID=2528021 RepID=A0A517YBV7_9BACT|nr:M48 family metalloprotease [Anatilimnocola aggregata]QDU27728.1 heat shock protein HtpX [Anatilimnocola aggregata]
MSHSQQTFTNLGFVKTFVLPALFIFVGPLVSLLFFLHAQHRYDSEIRAAILNQIDSEQNVAPDEKRAARQFFERVRVSQLLLTPEGDQLGLPDSTLRDYATFRWLIRLSIASLVGGVLVFAFAGICVLVSLRSQYAQYLSLLISWQVLRIYSALLTIAIGIMLVALSYWVTALWLNAFSVKLVVIAGILALCGVGAILAAIFKRPKHDIVVEGVVLPKDPSSSLWQALESICTKVGAQPPDQIVAGIDDNFFVTEQPLTADGKKLTGKTLFVSLALLKQLHAAEADAVLAHEMAHFSGRDTLFSKKIAPLLQRYEAYLDALYHGGYTRPIFYFMLCFRALFELSLGKHSREREFRADAIAAQVTSPHDFAGALLRIAAYSKFRTSVEQDLFSQEQALVTADVSQRIARGFPDYATAFSADPDVGLSETTHPFDSHPPMLQRFQAIGVQLNANDICSRLKVVGDGRWYYHIPHADELERAQWEEFEEQFRGFHESTLAYRLMPDNPAEQAIVERSFPALKIEGKQSAVEFDFSKCHHTPWPDPLPFNEISSSELNDSGVLSIHFTRAGKRTRTIDLNKFSQADQATILEEYQRYYGRYLSAVDYQQAKKLKFEALVPGMTASETKTDT